MARIRPDAGAPVTAEPVLYGAPYSVYVRIVRLALAEKGVPYRLEPIDIFAPGGPPADHLERHPFGKIPAFRHGDFGLYETDAILRYVDEGFDGPALTPDLGGPDRQAAVRLRARMTQIQRVLDNHAYPSLVWGLYVHEAGDDPAPDRVPEFLPAARRCLDALAGLYRGPFMLGARLSLADLHALPMFVYCRLAPSGAALLDERPGLASWLDQMQAREAVRQTRFPTEPA